MENRTQKPQITASDGASQQSTWKDSQQCVGIYLYNWNIEAS